MSASKNRSLDWSRCAEGFADFNIDIGSTTKKKAESVKRKSTESVFSHGNIFEKMAFGYEEEKSQSIAWSSSDDEKEKVVPIVKKPKRQTTPKTSAPTRRSARKTNKNQKEVIPEDTVEITDSEETASDVSPSKPIHDVNQPKTIQKPVLRTESGEVDDKQKYSVFDLNEGKSKKGLLSEDIQDIDLENDSDIVPTSQPTQDASSVKSEELMGIQSYDSDVEMNTDDVKSIADQEVEGSESQVTINEDSSQNSTSPVTSTGVKGSDWVKSLQLKTPSKSESQANKTEIEDSAKKRKKHTKSGLAEQLSRLQSRDKSAVRIWNHQQGKPSASQDSKSIQLEVIGYENLYSMQLVKCVVCKDKESDKADTDLKERLMEGDGKESDDPPAKKIRNERLVMFPASQSEQLNLQIGSRFKIFPPWQQLELNDGQQILLCTKYCHIVQQPDTTTRTSSTSGGDKLKDAVSAKWNCPCVQGLCCSQMLCPAYQFPFTPGQFQETVPAQESTSTQGKDSNSNLLKSTDKPTSHLFTVSLKPCTSTVPEAGSSSKQSNICDSLLKSIESCRTAVNAGDDGTVSFRGHVHRAVTVRNGSSKTRCHLLVEDQCGSLCEVQLSNKALTRAGFTTHSCENNTFIFSGLTVHERLIRDRNEGLFTMVDSVWSGKCVIDSQDSANSNNLLDRMAEPPGFCYILQETDMSSFTIEQCSSNLLPCKSPVYIQLSEVWKSEAMRRTSCLVKVFYIHSKENANILYVTDYSLKSLHSYSMIQISSACDFPKKLSTVSDRTVLILRDLFLSQGELRADGYTNISLSSDVLQIDATLNREMSRLQKVSIDVTDIHKGVTDDDLCIIKGEITEVDEDSAYSWEACVHCNSDQLQEVSSQGKMKCLSCKKTFVDAVTKMKMEVIVTCEKSNIQAKIDLLQGTIENLLPADEVDEDGYELSSVLSKKIGPLTCVVISSNSDTFKLKEIQLLK